MLHSDINLTMKVYTNLSRLDVASDLEKLPSFPSTPPQKLRATGTTDQRANDKGGAYDKTSFQNARFVARLPDDSCKNVSSIEEIQPPLHGRESAVSTNEQIPENQGFEVDCGLLRTTDDQEPPLGFEPRTYALRKHRSAS